MHAVPDFKEYPKEIQDMSKETLYEAIRNDQNKISTHYYDSLIRVIHQITLYKDKYNLLLNYAFSIMSAVIESLAFILPFSLLTHQYKFCICCVYYAYRFTFKGKLHLWVFYYFLIKCKKVPKVWFSFSVTK